MKHIVLPTDFSKNSWNAIFTALKMFATTESQFTLLHAYEPKGGDLLGEKTKQRLGVLYDSMEGYSQQELDKILAYLEEHHSNDKHRFETLSVQDDLEEALEGLLNKSEADLIVMGTQGASGTKGIFLGSNTVKVIKKIRNRPILVVPEAFNFQSLKKVVFPTDYSRPHESGEMLPLREILLSWKAALLVFYLAQEFELNETQLAVKALLGKRLEGIRHSFHEVVRTAPIAEAIADFAEEEGAGMIALVHYPHTFMEKLTREPVVKKISFRTQLPLLVLPDH